MELETARAHIGDKVYALGNPHDEGTIYDVGGSGVRVLFAGYPGTTTFTAAQLTLAGRPCGWCRDPECPGAPAHRREGDGDGEQVEAAAAAGAAE